MKVYVCPNCLNNKILFGNEPKQSHCEKCAGVMIKTDIDPEVFSNLSDIGKEAMIEMMIPEIAKEKGINSYKISQIENNRKKSSEEYLRETSIKYSSQSTEEPVRCPKCGSTQIQVLRKKWSPLTGILTNKVERVCVSCKHRF